MQKALNEEQAMQAASDHSWFGVPAVAWRQYSSGRYYEGTHEEFMEEGHLMDELLGGFEYGERTF